jgi:hypothetical protein
MPDFGPMLLRGAAEYAQTMLALAREAAESSAPTSAVPMEGTRFNSSTYGHLGCRRRAARATKPGMNKLLN